MAFDWGSFIGGLFKYFGDKKQFDDYFGKDVTDEHTKWRQDREKERFAYDPARDYTSEVAHQFIQQRFGPNSQGGYSPQFASNYAKQAGMGPATMPQRFKLDNYEFPTYWRKGYMDSQLGPPEDPNKGTEPDIPGEVEPIKNEPPDKLGPLPGDPYPDGSGGVPWDPNFIGDQDGKEPTNAPTDWKGLWELVKKYGPGFAASIIGGPLVAGKSFISRGDAISKMTPEQQEAAYAQLFGSVTGNATRDAIFDSITKADPSNPEHVKAYEKYLIDQGVPPNQAAIIAKESVFHGRYNPDYLNPWDMNRGSGYDMPNFNQTERGPRRGGGKF